MSTLPLLLQRFPELTPVFPWRPLLPNVPTPVDAIPARNLWVKRDDLACPRYGGNKARKFEWILGELTARGQSAFTTFGGFCSNHCTAAAIYGRAAGLGVTLLYLPTPLTAREYEELRLQAALGARQHLVGAGALAHLNGALVPPAGSTVAGVLGYVNAGLELAGQLADGTLPVPERIYLAAATRGTALGLAMGLVLAGVDPCPTVVAVETVTPFWQRSRFILPTPQRALSRLRSHSRTARERLPVRTQPLPCVARFGWDREPLGVVTPAVQATLCDAHEHGLMLDPHFSARAWAALSADRAGGYRGPALFWNTHGHVPEATLAAVSPEVKLPGTLERAVRGRLTT